MILTRAVYYIVSRKLGCERVEIGSMVYDIRFDSKFALKIKEKILREECST